MIKTMMAIMQDYNNYQQRKVDRTEVDGLIISTAYSSDCGYETAIIDVNGTYPVERYDNKLKSEKGHKNWVKKSKKLKTITSLGDADGWFDKKKIKLNRNIDKFKKMIKNSNKI